jgi:hypothetical protein
VLWPGQGLGVVKNAFTFSQFAPSLIASMPDDDHQPRPSNNRSQRSAGPLRNEPASIGPFDGAISTGVHMGMDVTVTPLDKKLQPRTVSTDCQ